LIFSFILSGPPGSVTGAAMGESVAVMARQFQRRARHVIGRHIAMLDGDGGVQ
jgi:transposase